VTYLNVLFLVMTLILSGCGGGDETPAGSPTTSVQSITLNMKSDTSVPYDTFTLSAKAPNSTSITAFNQTLATDQNRSIMIQGVNNNNTFYLYNIPLIAGTNEINITATNDKNETISRVFSFTSDANGSAPIGMQADAYSGVSYLQTNVDIGTSLDAQRYLIDNDGDGIIDEVKTDANFSVNLNKEGRYKPKVTIETSDNVLYSSDDFALSLDVKADANQTDPVGAQPVDAAKEFVKALIDNDRETVERLLGYNQTNIEFIYADSQRLNEAIAYYKTIIKWEQVYYNSSYATVTIYLDDNNTEQSDGGFEMFLADQQIKTGRYWLIRSFY
jgi:hypothetical protein